MPCKPGCSVSGSVPSASPCTRDGCPPLHQGGFLHLDKDAAYELIIVVTYVAAATHDTPCSKPEGVRSAEFPTLLCWQHLSMLGSPPTSLS